MTISPDEAARAAQQQRFGLRRLLRVNQQLATPEDLPLIEKVQAVKTAADYDKALADKKVADLFRRRVLYFGKEENHGN